MDLSDKLILLLFFFIDYLQAEEIKGTMGRNITVRFTFEGKLNNNWTIKYANLHMNGSKIEASNEKAVDNRRYFKLSSYVPVLHISNLTATDEGDYYVSLHYKELTGKFNESRKEVLRVYAEEQTTVSPSTSNHTERGPPKKTTHGFLFYIPIISGIMICITILSTGSIWWHHLYNKRGCQFPHQEPSPQGSCPKCQMTRELSASVEYNVLDFNRGLQGMERDRRSSPTPQPQDSVEYSTITFIHGPHGAGAAMPTKREH